jgi:hypothetical protein
LPITLILVFGSSAAWAESDVNAPVAAIAAITNRIVMSYPSSEIIVLDFGKKAPGPPGSTSP